MKAENKNGTGAVTMDCKNGAVTMDGRNCIYVFSSLKECIQNAFFPISKIQDLRIAEKSCANLGFGICQNTLTNPYENSLGIQDFDHAFFPRSKIQDLRIAEKSCANLGFGICQNTLTSPYETSLEIQDFDQKSCGKLGSWILNLAKNAFRMHSFGRIQDSRFKISRDSLEQILNPPPGLVVAVNHTFSLCHALSRAQEGAVGYRSSCFFLRSQLLHIVEREKTPAMGKSFMLSPEVQTWSADTASGIHIVPKNHDTNRGNMAVCQNPCTPGEHQNSWIYGCSFP